MAGFGQIFQTLLVVVGLVGAGAAARKLQFLRPDDARILTSLVNSFFLPALIFVAIKGTAKSTESLNPRILLLSLVAIITISICGIIAFIVGKFLGLGSSSADEKNRQERRRKMGAFVLTSMFGSTAFVALPLINGYYNNNGQATLEHTFYSEIGSLTLLVTVGVIIASFYGEGSRFGLQNLLSIPKAGPFVAMILALLLYREPFDTGAIYTILDMLSKATFPIIMFVLGVTIVWKDIRQYLKLIIGVNIIKLLIAPLLAVFLARLFGLPPLTQGVIFFNSAAPSIVFCLAYAALYKLDIEFASTAVFSSFFFSLITIPILSTFLVPPI
jgi:malate permease and related proteins